MDNENNIAQQIEEIEALDSIYGDQWKLEPETSSYSIKIARDISLFITLTEGYPSSCPPAFELLAPSLSAGEKKRISEEFREIYESSCGSPVLFQWIERAKEIVESHGGGAESAVNAGGAQGRSSPEIPKQESQEEREEFRLQVTHGPVIQDRKSTFQGHACVVNSMEETRIFMNYLLENKKIAQATHNISAYRIPMANGSVAQDCDDDGENHAGGRLLHLLQILNLNSVMVVVTRWYGGIHLGPDRFKHINNAAREVLIQGGFIKT